MTERKFVKQLERLFTSEGFLVKDEVGAGFGIADLVLIRINASNSKIRKDYNQKSPLPNEDYFKTLRFIPDTESNKEAVDLQFLIKKTGLSLPTLKYKILSDLKDKGYIKEEGKDLFVKINGWLPIAKDVIAIEAKMKDWKRGFLQANRYKSFADKVYLAIPSNIEHLVDQALLKKHNVGLIVLDPETQKKKIVIEAIKGTALSFDKRNAVTELFWSSI